MPLGKADGVPCIQLDELHLCRLFGTPQRPEVCRHFRAGTEYCGSSSSEAMQRLEELERLTR
jgi:hypothetical protein